MSARDRRLAIEQSLEHESSTLSQIKTQMEQADQATLAMNRGVGELYFFFNVIKIPGRNYKPESPFIVRPGLLNNSSNSNSILCSFGSRLDKFRVIS